MMASHLTALLVYWRIASSLRGKSWYLGWIGASSNKSFNLDRRNKVAGCVACRLDLAHKQASIIMTFYVFFVKSRDHYQEISSFS